MIGAVVPGRDEAGFGAAFGGLAGMGCGYPVAGVAVGDGAEVPPVQGVFFQPFPDFVFELDPVPFRDALLNPPDQNGGRVDPFDLSGSSVANSGMPWSCEFFFQFQRVEHVRGRTALDVFADHDGEIGAWGISPRAAGRRSRRRGGSRRRRTTARRRRGRGWSRSIAAGFHVPVAGGDPPAGRQPLGAGCGSAGAGRPSGPAAAGWRCGPGSPPGPARPARRSRRPALRLG